MLAWYVAILAGCGPDALESWPDLEAWDEAAERIAAAPGEPDLRIYRDRPGIRRWTRELAAG